MVLDAICNSLTKDPRHNFPQSPPLHILPQIHIFKDISLQRRSVGSTSQSLDFSSDTFQARWTHIGTMGIYFPLILGEQHYKKQNFTASIFLLLNCLYISHYCFFIKQLSLGPMTCCYNSERKNIYICNS